MEKFSLDKLIEQSFGGTFEDDDLACYHALWFAIVMLSKNPQATNKLLGFMAHVEADLNRKVIDAGKNKETV